MWYRRRESNPHGKSHWNLNPARLPVPPRRHIERVVGAVSATRLQADGHDAIRNIGIAHQQFKVPRSGHHPFQILVLLNELLERT